MVSAGRRLMVCSRYAAAGFAHILQPMHSLHLLREVSSCGKRDGGFRHQGTPGFFP